MLYQVALTSSDLIVSLFSLVSHFVEVHKYIQKSFHSGVSHPFEWLPLGNYLIGWKAWSCLFAQACHGWAFRRAIRGAERLPDCSRCRERIDSTWTFVCFLFNGSKILNKYLYLDFIELFVCFQNPANNMKHLTFSSHRWNTGVVFSAQMTTQMIRCSSWLYLSINCKGSKIHTLHLD